MSSTSDLRVKGRAIEFHRIQNDAGSYAEVKMWFAVNGEVRNWTAEVRDDDAYTYLQLDLPEWYIRRDTLYSPIAVSAWGIEEDNWGDDDLGSGVVYHARDDVPAYGIGPIHRLSVTGDEGDTSWSFHYQILSTQPLRSSIQRQELLGALRSRWEARGVKQAFSEDTMVKRFVDKMLARGYTLLEVDDDRLVWEGPEAMKTVVARLAVKKA